MKIDYLSALQAIPHRQGAWLLYGDEPLLQQNLLDAFHQYWHAQQIERQRFDLNTINDWKLVFHALDSLSLFATQLAVEVHGNIKPDKQIQSQLNQFLQHHQGNSLLMVLPKQESQFNKSVFYQSVEQHGTVVHLYANSPKEQQHILQLEAKKLGIDLDYDAWQWLLHHHEHNLLAGRNSLMLLADTLPQQQHFSHHDVMSCLHDQSRYTVYDLGDALIYGDLAQCLKIFTYLQEIDEPMSLILWVISREVKLLMQLYEQPHQAGQLGIWKNKIPQYQSALRRVSAETLARLPQDLLRLDQAIKGVIADNPAHLCQQIIMLLCIKSPILP